MRWRVIARPCQSYVVHSSAGTFTCWANVRNRRRRDVSRALREPRLDLEDFSNRAKPSRFAPVLFRSRTTSSSRSVQTSIRSSFCALLGLPVIAITPGSLTAFVERLCWQPGWKAGTFTAPSTNDRRLSGVVVTGRTDYKLALDRTVAARARRVLKAKVKQLQKTDEVRGRGPAPALLVAHLRADLDATPDTRLGIRDRAIVLLQFAIAGREHAVAHLRLRDVVEAVHSLQVDVRVSKTSPRQVKVPFGSRPSTCPVRAWRAWTEADRPHRPRRLRLPDPVHACSPLRRGWAARSRRARQVVRGARSHLGGRSRRTDSHDLLLPGGAGRAAAHACVARSAGPRCSRRTVPGSVPRRGGCRGAMARSRAVECCSMASAVCWRLKPRSLNLK